MVVCVRGQRCCSFTHLNGIFSPIKGKNGCLMCCWLAVLCWLFCTVLSWRSYLQGNKISKLAAQTFDKNTKLSAAVSRASECGGVLWPPSRHHRRAP